MSHGVEHSGGPGGSSAHPAVVLVALKLGPCLRPSFRSWGGLGSAWSPRCHPPAAVGVQRHRPQAPAGLGGAAGARRPRGWPAARSPAAGQCGHGTVWAQGSVPTGQCAHRPVSPSGQYDHRTVCLSGQCDHRTVSPSGQCPHRTVWAQDSVPTGQCALGSWRSCGFTQSVPSCLGHTPQGLLAQDVGASTARVCVGTLGVIYSQGQCVLGFAGHSTPTGPSKVSRAVRDRQQSVHEQKMGLLYFFMGLKDQ